jgi:putative salt-induced outer membrane protein YdiY/small nuclear ribonucleoprotein (snRNP)-like protein
LPRNVFLMLVLSLCGGTALADQVTLKNGDRLTGTIVKTDEDKLEFKSEFVGDVKLPWSAIVAIVSAEPLHVALKNGQTVVGVVTTKDDKFEIAAPSGPIEAPKTEVVAVRSNAEQDVYMRMEHPGLLDLDVWAALFDTGLSFTRGNSESTSFALTGKAARVTKKTKLSLYSTEIYARSTIAGVTSTTASAIRGGARLDVNLRGRSFAFGLADFEHDRFQALDLRSVLGGGLGYHLIKEKDRTLDVFAGATYNHESYSQPFNPPNPSTTRNTAEIVLGETLATKLGSRTTLGEQFSFFPNLSDTGDYRLQLDATAATKIKNWLSWQITFSDRYVNTPLLGLKNNDVLFTTGLRLTYGKGVF